MKIISSQHYLDCDIVDAKACALKAAKAETVTIPCTYVGVIDGDEYAVQADRHHTLAAARELGLIVEYDVCDDPEGLCGDVLLDARYIDGDYYYVETSNPAENVFDLVW